MGGGRDILKYERDILGQVRVTLGQVRVMRWASYGYTLGKIRVYTRAS